MPPLPTRPAFLGPGCARHTDRDGVMLTLRDLLFALRHLASLLTSFDQGACGCLKGAITPAEIQATVRATARNRTPGHDGLLIESYESFLALLLPFLVEIVNGVYTSRAPPAFPKPPGTLSPPTRLTFGTGARSPCSAPIIAKIVASRLRLAIASLVHPDQTCAIPGRRIYQNLYTLRNVIAHATQSCRATNMISALLPTPLTSLSCSTLTVSARTSPTSSLFTPIVILWS